MTPVGSSCLWPMVPSMALHQMVEAVAFPSSFRDPLDDEIDKIDDVEVAAVACDR